MLTMRQYLEQVIIFEITVTSQVATAYVQDLTGVYQHGLQMLGPLFQFQRPAASDDSLGGTSRFFEVQMLPTICTES